MLIIVLLLIQFYVVEYNKSFIIFNKCMKPRYKNLGVLIYFSKLQQNMFKKIESTKSIVPYIPPKNKIVAYTRLQKISSIKPPVRIELTTTTLQG
jgi:hypothetical protein